MVLKSIRKIFKWLIVFLGAVMLVLSLLGYYIMTKKEKLISFFKEYFKQKYHLEIQNEKTGLDFDFSTLSFGFEVNKFKISDVKAQKQLLFAKHLFIGISLRKLLEKKFIIKSIKVTGGNIFIPKSESSQSEDKNIDIAKIPIFQEKIQIKNIHFVDTTIDFEKKINIINKSVLLNNVKIDINSNNDLQCRITGDIFLKKLVEKKYCYATNLPLNLSINIKYDPNKKIIELKKSNVLINKMMVDVDGQVSLNDLSATQLNISSSHIDLEKIIEILPASIAKEIKASNISGLLSCDIHLTKPNKNTYDIAGNISAKKLELYSINKNKIAVYNMNGQVSLPDHKNLENLNIKVQIKKINIGNSSFSINGNSIGYKYPSIKMEMLGEFDFEKPLKISTDQKCKIKNRSIETQILDVTNMLRGKVKTNMTVEFKKNDKRKNKHNNFNKYDLNVNGKIDANNLAYIEDGKKIENIVGSINITNNSIYCDKLNFNYLDSNISLIMKAKNAIDYFMKNTPKLKIDTEIHAGKINLGLFNLSNEADKKTSDNKLKLPKEILLNSNIKIDKLSYKNFEGDNFLIELQLRYNKILINKLDFILGKGKVSVKGKIDEKKKEITSKMIVTTSNVDIDTFFYAFDNFTQKFITNENLEGKFFSKTNFTLNFDKKWSPKWETLLGEMDIKINAAKLKKFQPLEKISDYADEKDLAELFFPVIQNKIKIENKTVIIPPMKVDSNVTELIVSGRHDFNNDIEYKFVLPLKKNFKKNNNGEEKKAKRKFDLSGPKLYLTLYGKSDNYKVKTNITSSITKEILKQSLDIGKLLIGQYKEKNKDKELSHDEYFEFDE